MNQEQRAERFRAWNKQLLQAMGSTPGGGWILIGDVISQIEKIEEEAKLTPAERELKNLPYHAIKGE